MHTQHINQYLERIGSLLRSDLRRSGAEHGLQPVQVEALHYLSICNKYSDTPMAVSEYLGQTKGTVSQSLKLLEKKGFIRKQTDQQDKRITHLHLTDTGQELIKKIYPSTVLAQAVQEFSITETSLAAMLAELLRRLQEANNNKSFGLCKTCQHHLQQANGGYHCQLTGAQLHEQEINLICREHKIVR